MGTASSKVIAKLKEEKKKKKLDAAARKRKADEELDRFEERLEDLRVTFEQFFIDVLPFPPDKQHSELVRYIRQLLKMPFQNSAAKFRLRMLIHRYRCYRTYWERVLREREEGRYAKDVFKAELHAKLAAEEKREGTRAGMAEKTLHLLFRSYESALKKSGAKAENLNFDAFRKSMLRKAKQLKEQNKGKKLSYKVVTTGGKVMIKASVKE